MRNMALLLTLLVGCATDKEAPLPSSGQVSDPPTYVPSACEVAAGGHAAGAATLEVCPDRDGDGVRGVERCGQVPADAVPPDCVPRFDPSRRTDAWEDLRAWSLSEHPPGSFFDQTAYETPLDCDDNDPTVFPGATEVLIDGRDQNCNGMADDVLVLYADGDGDGYPVVDAASAFGARSPVSCTGGLEDPTYPCRTGEKGGYAFVAARADGLGDCDDEDPRIHPEADERVEEEQDLDCDGAVSCYADHDLDGRGDGAQPTIPSSNLLYCRTDHGEARSSGDCDDTRADVSPDEPELLDGVDNNCNGVIDEKHCSLQFFITPIRGTTLHGWKASLLLGALSRDGAPTAATITIGNGAAPAPLSGFGPNWVWPDTPPAPPGTGDIALAYDASMGLFVRIDTSSDYLGSLALNGDYWVSDGLYWGWSRRLFAKAADLTNRPFTISAPLLSCSDVKVGSGGSVRLDWSLDDGNNGYVDLVPLR